MRNQQMKFVAFLALVGFTMSLTQADARLENHRVEQPPRLDDTLAVAKSPLEPVTMPLSLPARTDQQPLETTPKIVADSDLLSSSSEQNEHEYRRTTRSAQSSEEHESSSSMRGVSGSNESVSKGAEGSNSTEATAEAETKANESELTTTTTTSPAINSTDVATKVEPAGSTTTELASITTEETTTTKQAETTTEQPTTTTEKPTTATEQPKTTTSTALVPTTTESATTNEDKSSPDLSSTNLKEDEEKMKVSEQTTTATAFSDATSEASTEAPQSTTTTTSASAEPSTTTLTVVEVEVEREQASSTTQQPTTTTATTMTEAASSPAPTTTTTTKPAKVPEKEEDEKSSCNHLPTYDSEEIQKVFREETTFKNGTIKGKFTYINFDQRYRLVHYTRLPYGPVKIDRVEELGRPNQSSSTPTLSEVPNAVLQLRNLLPNSLFGFPFLGPQNSQAQPGQPPQFTGPNGREADDDRSNMYFYSTDSLSTPNLLTPQVPVSVLPGQRLKALALGQPAPGSSSSAPQADMLEHSYLGHPAKPVAFGMPNNPQGDYSKQLNKLAEPSSQQAATSRSDSQSSTGSRNQFQYATNPFAQPQASPSPDQANNKGLVYSYYTSNAHPASHHYQYAPLPPPSPLYQQSFPIRVHHHLADPTRLAPADHLQQTASSSFFVQHHHQPHQPHSHEHYMAPFMLTQPVESLQLNNDDSSRLRLRVKTSKALNQEGTKSAQLRMRSSGGHSSTAPVESTVKQHQRGQQQRLGKQNHQLKLSSTPTNRSPVVYHVLRNPYNQYNQGYALAYDQDN